MSTPFIKCLVCKRYKVNRKCDAFPDGIPDEIWNGNKEHIEPYMGDKGLRFEVDGKMLAKKGK